MKLKKVPVLDMFGYIEGFECPSKRIKIVKCDKESADAVIVPNHYSHKAVSNSCINMLVIYNDKVEGAMQIGYGIRPKIKGDLDAESTREFDRMWLSDNMPKFSETIALSLAKVPTGNAQGNKAPHFIRRHIGRENGNDLQGWKLQVRG